MVVDRARVQAELGAAAVPLLGAALTALKRYFHHSIPMERLPHFTMRDLGSARAALEIPQLQIAILLFRML